MTINKHNFWRDERTNRSTNTGINNNVISKKNPKCTSQEFLEYLKEVCTPCNISDLKNISRYHKQVLSNCIEDVNKTKVGYLFSDEQLKNFITVYNNLDAIIAIYEPADNVWEIHSKSNCKEFMEEKQ